MDFNLPRGHLYKKALIKVLGRRIALFVERSWRSLSDGFGMSNTRTDITDSLHDAFEFRTDYEIVTNKHLKKILKDMKK